MPRPVALLACLVLLVGAWPDRAWAHAGLRTSTPREGVRLGASPTRIELSFFERPEIALSSVHVLDTSGAAYQVGDLQGLAGDPLSVFVPVRSLGRGIYIVHWRIVSAVDGHVTAGSFAFGVGVSPRGAAPGASNTYPATSRVEMLARAALLVGLMLVVGAASATCAGIGGAGGIPLAACGSAVALVGLAVLAAAQSHAAGNTFAALLRTGIGRALAERAAAIGVTVVSLGVAYGTRRRAGAVAVAGVAALTAIAFHVIAGHAAATVRPTLAIVVQGLHFAAAGVWFGGLAALLLAVRGEPAPAKVEAARRFSAIAAGALALVTITGVVRAVQQLSAWSQLMSLAYGWAVLAKAALLVAIAGCGGVNRWGGLPRVAVTFRPLRRVAIVELLLMLAAAAIAGIMGTLPPPSAGRLLEAGVIDVSGADFATSVRANLTAPSDQPGPNRFTVRVVDYDSEAPVRAARVSLQFVPVDDPAVAPTSLALEPGPGDRYTGTGSNLSFDGRWTVTVLVERAGGSTQVPLGVDVRGTPLPVMVDRRPGQLPRLGVAFKGEGSIWLSPDTERAGPATLHITVFDVIGEYLPVDSMIVTATARGVPVHQLTVHRVDRNTFTAAIAMEPGVNTIAVVAHASDGARLRAVVDVDASASAKGRKPSS